MQGTSLADGSVHNDEFRKRHTGDILYILHVGDDDILDNLDVGDDEIPEVLHVRDDEVLYGPVLVGSVRQVAADDDGDLGAGRRESRAGQTSFHTKSNFA